MGVYVKGNPKEGEYKLIKTTDGFVLEGEDIAYACVEVDDELIPTPHGRLIDIEKLKEEFAMKNNICKECDSFKKCDNKTYSKSEICEKFIWVPTILEAEE